MRKVISQTNRNGFHYILDRTNGQFIKGEPFTQVNWTAGLDPKTGKPTDYDPHKAVQNYAGKVIKYGRKAMTSILPTMGCRHSCRTPTTRRVGSPISRP